MNKRKNLWILFSLILVFFFVGCSDFYQDMGGSSIEMSFKVPEKIDERALVSRSDTETDISTYKLVVKLESKNELLDKIEKNVCSGEIVNLAFTNVKKGKTVKVSAQLFQDGKSVYFGESDWINTTKGKNYAKVVLEKDYRPLVPEITLQPSDEIHFMLNENENDVLSIPFIVTAKIEYEQNLSVQLQEKTEKGWINFEYTFDEKSKIPYENTLMIMPTININIGESKVLRAAFTNSVTTETGKINSVTVYSNEVTLAYVNIDGYSLKHARGYVIYGEEINIEDFELFANYTLNDNEKSAPVTITGVTCNNSDVIGVGDVPFTFDLRFIENGNKHCTASFNVPVKYQLNAEKLAITAIVTNDGNTEATDSGSGLNIAQYTQNVKLSANYDDTVNLYTEGTDNSESINILDYCNINWASDSGDPSIGPTITIQDESNPLLQDLATYECTISPNANIDFIVDESVTKEYFVNVCPWEIKLQLQSTETLDGFDNKTLEGGKTYLPKLTNEAIGDGTSPSDVIYTVDVKDFSIAEETNVITAPIVSTTDQNATIEAIWKGKEIASLEVVVPASSTSGGTTGGGTGNTEATVSAKDLTFNNTNQQMIVKSYEGLKTVAKIINGEIEESETIIISSSHENEPGAEYSSETDGLDTIGILLSNDIELDSDWTGIGTEGNPYNGIFNGGNYSIKYNGNTKPLFNNAGGTKCNISSLVVNGELTSSEPYLGGIVSSFSGGTIENCVNNAIITNNYSTNDSTATGGIVGYLDNAENACTIQNCVNLVSISAKTYVGGIVGHGVSSNNAGQSVTVSKCINIGDISSNSTESGAYQAGIMGGSSFNVNYQCISITDCLNKGEIVYNSNNSSGAGIVNNPGQTYVKVTNCINAGHVNTYSSVMISDINYTNSYFDKTVNNKSFDNGKTTEELVKGEGISATTFENWVFSTEGNSYPYPDIGSSLPVGENGTTWETVLEALEVNLPSGGGTSTYQIGEVYSENGTAMGVVFEVAEDNSYIKIVALKDLDNHYTWATSGVIFTDDQPNAYDVNNGDVNFEAIKSYVEANSKSGFSLVNDFKIFNYTSQFYQISESEKGEWYVPALNELKAVIQYQKDGKFNYENYTAILSGKSYWSSTLISGTTNAYYATTNDQEQQQGVQTSCYVRPVRKIILQE